MKNILKKFDRPAADWNEALPLGNGFMGAMCFGGNMADRFQLNNDSLWHGGFKNRVNPSAIEKLPEVRRLIDEGRIYEAEELANEALAAIPDYQCHYEPLCDLFLLEDCGERINIFGLKDGWNGAITRFLPCEGYVRSLNMEKGIHEKEYYTNNGQLRHHRECFISNPDRVMAIKSHGGSYRAIIERGYYAGEVSIENGTVYMQGQAGADGVKYVIGLRCIEGLAEIVGRTLHCKGESVLLVASETSFYESDPKACVEKTLDAAEKLGYEKLKERHIADFSSLMNRCEIDIEGRERVCEAFNFGRYLLISSSRPGSLPANLQGIWNKDFLPAWDSKYTININAEMNYWPAEVCNLSELTEPLFSLFKRMVPKGRAVAREMYGVEGFMAHHNTDIWGDCAPQDTWPSSTYWQMGAVWLCLHVIEHYRYSKDAAFLGEFMPIIKEAILFFENTLVPNAAGELVVNPTVSPENTYRLKNGEQGTICKGAAMDSQILRELLKGVLEIGESPEGRELLSGDERRRYREFMDRLPMDKIGEDGRILEWAEPYEEVEPGHRHISHLFGVYPGTTLLSENFKRAAEKTLEVRLKNGGGHTGWSIAWILCMYARLGLGEKCEKTLNKYFENSVLPNGFCNHPPFQIDGNFGITAGIAEMLLQDYDGETVLLKSIPESWHKGCVRGLRSRSGQEISFSWENGTINMQTD